MKKIKTIFAISFVLAALLIAPAAGSCAGPPQPVPDASIFQNSTGIALDPAGNILVTIRHHAVRTFSPSGQIISTWGSEGFDEGKLGWATYSTSDSQGFVYITDQKNRRILKFSHDGEYITHWDYFRDDPGWCPVPRTTCDSNWYMATHSLGGIAAGPDGNLYIADVLNNSISVITSDGKFLEKWGPDGTGTGKQLSPQTETAQDGAGGKIFIFDGIPAVVPRENGQLFLPQDVAVDREGNVFVSDYGNYRIQKFSSDGAFLTAWGSEGTGDTQFLEPGGITVDRNGFVYVIDTGLSCVKKFTGNGTFVKKWGTRGVRNGQFLKPFDIVIDETDHVYVTDSSDESVQKFTADGVFLYKWKTSPETPGQVPEQSGFSILRRDDIPLIRSIAAKQVLNISVRRVPQRIALDSADNIYMIDGINATIWKFSPWGEVVAYWGSYGSGKGQFRESENIAIDNRDFIYITDSVNNRIQKFSSDGEYITHWDFLENDGIRCLSSLSSFGVYELFFHVASGVAVDTQGNLYIADGAHDSIYIMTQDGEYIAKWGSSGSGNGQFNQPYDIAFDRQGNFFVVDKGNYRVQKFSSNGTFLTSWGSEGTGNGQFMLPLGITVDRKGFVYVIDPKIGCIQKFTGSGTFLLKWDLKSFSKNPEATFYDAATDRDDNIYVTTGADNCILKFNSDGKYLKEFCGVPYRSPRTPSPGQQIPSPDQQTPSAPGFLDFPAIAAIVLVWLNICRK
ncbi:MAG: Virginiamycin B lyase [Methanoregula sp. PtaU1.Bin006]|nr:MAG: Virginiamycin B lyase [Methanoregula sp. PtaB.Bin085]OPY35614.1 MAG: Virginiamycin B lyase [Methanoregula sp. PtaU1.Bin006]